MKKKILLFLLILCMGLIPKVTLAETYEGEYSIDYLLRNYSVVTLGTKNISNISPYDNSNSLTENVNKGDISNIYSIEGAILVANNYNSNSNATFGSNAGNVKSFIKGTKGDNVTTPAQVVTDSNYIDFDKLYTNIMNESEEIAASTEYHINSAKIEITKPGIYTVHKTAIMKYSTDNNSYSSNSILIKNYDKNGLYIINIYNEVALLPPIDIMKSGASSIMSLEELINSGEYTGNIIYNCPNAKYLSQTINTVGNIIAPKATVYTYNTIGSIICNTLVGYSEQINDIKKRNYNLDKKIINTSSNSSFREVTDYSDDFYARDYSISDLLQNYSLITLGKKAIDSKSKLLELGSKPGSVKLFHITGQALIAGDLYGKVYNGTEDDYYGYYLKFDRTVFDLESNEAGESYIKGNIMKEVGRMNSSGTYNFPMAVIQPYDPTTERENYAYNKNIIFLNSQANQNYNFGYNPSSAGYIVPTSISYVNFDRLYNNIIAEQSKIEEGTSITPSNGKAHIRVGGSYVIDNINDIDEVIFDNFDDNKNKITVITIKNEGDINFPLISRDTGSYKGIVTNDYFGKNHATHFYEQDTFINEDSYYGNIIWNVPNATYIKLKENAPFAGHLIAPKADVDTPELHFAGCFIVNSIYGEGNTEAHFYPLTATATYDVPEYDDLTSSEKSKLAAMRLGRLLGRSGSQIETVVLGDETQYRNETTKLDVLLDNEEKNSSNRGGILAPIIEELQTNPKTVSRIVIVIGLLSMIGLSLYTTFKHKKNNN